MSPSAMRPYQSNGLPSHGTNEKEMLPPRNAARPPLSFSQPSKATGYNPDATLEGVPIRLYVTQGFPCHLSSFYVLTSCILGRLERYLVFFEDHHTRIAS